MDWIHNYNLFLFDFDGLLVNTEELHWKAYINMCQSRGFALAWSFSRYCLAAHFHSTGLQEHVYAELPALQELEPDWSVLYQEKKKEYLKLLHETDITLMPGAEELLVALEKASIKRCVVTHSPLEQIDFIRERLPLLDTIPWWITREHYNRAKPCPECYLKAIDTYSEKGDKIIGFEDTPRGLAALQNTPAQAVFVSSTPYKDMGAIVKRGTVHLSSLVEMEGFFNTAS